jgi:hypothetical protein
MKGFFDMSVLVPVFYGDHIHHQSSLALFIQFDKSTGCCGAHSLAEVYSTLTRMPGKHRISAEQTMIFIGSIRERLSIVALNGEEYADALKISAALELWVEASMTRCWRIAPSKRGRKQSIAGTAGTTDSAVWKSPGACGRLRSVSITCPANTLNGSQSR